MNKKVDRKRILQTVLVISIASFFSAIFVLNYLKINLSKAGPAPVSCKGKATSNCTHVESGGPSHCDKEGHWCRKERLECEYTKVGGGTGYCVKETKEVCTPDVVKKCIKTTLTPTTTSTGTATPTPTTTPTITPILTATPTTTPTPTYTPGEPNYCGGTCGSNYNCQGGYFCFNGFCRNPICASDSDCNCDSTPTAPPVLGTSITKVLPKTGGGLPFVVFSSLLGGIGFWLFKKNK